MPLVDTITTIAPEYGLQPEWVMAVVEIESSYNKSPRPRYEQHIQDWSFGYGQVLSSTAAWLIETERVSPIVATHYLKAFWRALFSGLKPILQVFEDAEISIHLTCSYLKYQMQRYGDIEKAVAAYNAGSVRYRDDGSYVNQWHVDKFNKALERIQSHETLDAALAAFGNS